MYGVTLSDAANDLFVWMLESNDDFFEFIVKVKNKTLCMIDDHSSPMRKALCIIR